MQSHRKRIEDLIETSKTGTINQQLEAFKRSVKLLIEIDEERESLWSMLDEMKASDIQNHARAQKEALDESMARIQGLMISRVEEA